MSSGWNKRVRMATGLVRVVAAARWMAVAAVGYMGVLGCSEGGILNSDGGIRSLFAKAEKAEKSGNINFFGFYTGMPMADAEALAAHYGIQQEEYGSGLFGIMDFWGIPTRTFDENVETHEVCRMRFNLKQVRSITRGGNTFRELVLAVVNQVGDMEWVDGSYSRKTIDDIVIVMNETLGCVIVNHPRKEKAEQAEQRAEQKKRRAATHMTEWFEAAMQGDAEALASLRQAAEQGDAVAQRTLGWIEQEGHEVEQGNENTLVMVTEATFPPFEFLDAGEIVGIDVSICNEIAKELGKTLALRNQPFEAVIPTLMAGNADIAAAGIMVTEERKQNVDFSIPYMTTGIGIIRKAGDETITGGDSLQGKQVGVQSGTTSDVYLVDEMGLEPEEYDSTMSAVTALKAGDLDAVVADIDLVIAITAEDANVEMSPEPLSKEDYAVAVRKGNTDLLAVANRVIERIKASGEYDRFREEAEARCNALN